MSLLLLLLHAAGRADIFLDESCDVSRMADSSAPAVNVDSSASARLGYSCAPWLPTAG